MIRLDLVPKGAIPGEGPTVIVAGRGGIYRRIDARREEWFVEIEGKTVVIRLDARHRTSAADLA